MSSMVVNGAAILAAIAQRSAELSFSEAQVNDIAMGILVTKLKDKDLKIEHLRKLAAGIGDSDIKLVLEYLPARDATALVKRLDPKNPDLKGADDAWTRDRVTSLILGGAEASAPAPKARAPARSTGSKTGKALQSKALKPRAPKKAAKAAAD